MRFGIFMIIIVGLMFVLSGCGEPDITAPSDVPDVVDDGLDVQPDIPKDDFCDDSDNGITFFVKGEVLDLDGIHEDECINDLSLREYYCKNNEMRYEDYECLYGCADSVCLKDSEKEVESEKEDEKEVPEEEAGLEDDIICGSRQSITCPEGYSCFDHPNAQPEFGICQPQELFPKGDEYEGIIKCPPTKIDVEDCPKGLDRVCATYFDSVRKRDTLKMFDSACLACSDVSTIGYKVGRC